MLFSIGKMETDNFVQHAEGKRNSVETSINEPFVIAIGVCFLFSICFLVCSFAEFEQPGQIQLDSQINPNNAPVASLMRLPGIGVSRAEAILAYRHSWTGENQGQVFKDCNDLQKIKGIGPKTVQRVKQWLKFK